MISNKLPKISLVVLTFNGGGLLKKCLSSIQSQNYPKRLVEIVAVDNGSFDDSVKIAKSYGARVFIRPKTDLYRNWAIAIHRAKGDLTYLVDQDIELRGKNFLKKMVYPLTDDKSLAGSFTRTYPNKKMSWITKFLSYHPSQCDPLYEFLTPSIESNIIEKKDKYMVCDFTRLENLPAESRMLHRIKILKNTPNWKEYRLFDHDTLVKTIKSGYSKFAYVPDAGIYHYHAKDFITLLKKRVRNLKIHYFPFNKTLEYRWLDIGNKKMVLRLILWVIYANLLFPAFIRGFWRFLEYRDWVLLTEPFVAIAVTDVVLFSFLLNPAGRKIILNSLISLFRA